MRLPTILIIIASALAGHLLAGPSASFLPVSETASAGSMPLSAGGLAAPIYHSAGDAAVVGTAANLLRDDVQRVTGLTPAVSTAAPLVGSNAVFIGTVGNSSLIDGLIAAGKIDAAAIQGKWESYIAVIVANPVAGVSQALVIAGSDRRGTAYGVISLSEAMGVSPWYWWADVPAASRSVLHVGTGTFTSKEPSVRFRGIFINDEDWGLQEWAEKNYESGAAEVKDIGPKTHAKVFELLLRMKANCIWPAMHPSTAAFNAYAQNKVVADQYAIVMGSSHAEPMLRNNVYEWSRFVDPANGQSYTDTQFNYQTNQGGVYRYWEQAAINNGIYENIYTLGKRGIHDSGMVEGTGNTEKASWLNTIFAAQRQILAARVNANPAQVPQVFVPYKEVLDIYDTGLVNVPGDVTLVWPDDNHGYIRRLSNPSEQLRSGGGGVYYHISYWGAPADYLWLCSTPPALIWEELTKAYAYNCKRIWIINVGDIKPGEIGMEFAMRLAWDVDRYGANAQLAWLTEWAGREFGGENAAAIASLLDDYYKLGHARKPEHMNWVDTDPLTPAGPYPLFSHVHHGDEAAIRLASYADLVQRANAINSALPQAMRDAFFQTVLYPVTGADAMNRKFLNAGRAYIASAQGRNTVAARKAASQSGYNDIQTLTTTYNQAISGGKWNEMMDAKPRALAVFNQPALPADPSLGTGSLGVAIEGRLEPAYLTSGGVVFKPLPGSLALNAATDGTLISPMQVATIGGRQAIWTPGSTGVSIPAGSGGRATYTFNIAAAGSYTLSCEVHCPTANDDSWWVQIDGGTATAWNNLNNGGAWTWAQFGAVTLGAGSHTLAIHQREDGAAMASIKLASTAGVIVEDRSQATFQFPEFSARTRRSQFLDLFNTGTGSVGWQITTAAPWLVVDQISGTTGSEERRRVAIDWKNAPRTGVISSSVTVTSAGQSLVIPVMAWNPPEPLPATVDFVEDNGTVAIEAEHFSSRTAGTDASWTELPGLGGDGGSMFVSPPTALSRPTVPEILSSSPMMEYKVFLRQAGAISLATTAIPTLAINTARGLRYAVAFDGAAPQIVDMNRTSGTGSVWGRSVLRAKITYTTNHTLAAAGEHTLKVWMVDPGVVLDRFLISTGAIPYSFQGPQESPAVNHGVLTIPSGETHVPQSGRSRVYDSLVNHGVLNATGGEITILDDVLNNGTIRLYGDSGFQTDGQFVNNGLLDVMTWSGTLPAGFQNDGTLLDQSAVRVKGIATSGNDFQITVDGYAGHNYQLQESVGESLVGAWSELGAPTAGTGAPITYSIEDAFVSPKRFFRVKVAP